MRDSGDQTPLILISNDDGIDASGIAALAAALTGLGDVHVVAPESEQSAVGHAITVRDPVRAHARDFDVPGGHVPAWAVSGTPADCVKLACNNLLPRKPDLVVSGVNHGPNTAVNVLYSGTVSAASEGCILGCPAIAISHASWTPVSDYAVAASYARRIAAAVLKNGLPDATLLNVNVPEGEEHDIQGIKITRLARARWDEAFVPRLDPLERPYYWLAGRFVNLDTGSDNDLAAVDDGFVSVTPLQLDLTAYAVMDQLKEWNL